jgi:hypothetical protein
MSASKSPALFALLLLGLLALACGGGSSDDNIGDTDPSKVAGNFARVKSFRATISGGEGSPEALIEYQEPNSVRATVGSGAMEQQIVCINNDFYAKRAGEWQKVPEGGGSNPSCRANLGASDPKVIADGIRAATADPALFKGGQAKVNGKPCQLFVHQVPSGGSVELCVAGGLPRRIVSKGVGPQAVTITFTEFDKNVEIKQPI